MNPILYKVWDDDKWYFKVSNDYISNCEISVYIAENRVDNISKCGNYIKGSNDLTKDDILDYIYISGKYVAYSWYCLNILKEEPKPTNEFTEISLYRNIK